MKSLLTEPLGLYGWAGLEPVLLAALASEEPLLLVGPHGCAKSFVLERLAESLGLVFRDAIEGAAVPRKYAVAPSLRGEERPRFSDGLPTVCCEDPDLVMAVVGRIAGQLYVPLRPVRVRPEALDLWYLFDRADFPSVR